MIVSRSKGSNACCKGAYNARVKIKDEQTNVTYNFSRHGDNVYHEILLPAHVDKKFKDVAVLMNEVERKEKRKDSQLLKEVVIALPDDKELNLEDRIEITKRIIKKRGWVEAGVGVQIDIHKPHDGERNWHAHLLITTRRFNEAGLELGEKANDLNPQIRGGGKNRYTIPEEEMIHEEAKEIINNYFKELGLENRVDAISTVPGRHIGPERMRSLINSVVEENELRNIAHLENLKDGDGVLNRITRNQAIFTKRDIERAVKEVDGFEARRELVEQVMNSAKLVRLYDDDRDSNSRGKEKEGSNKRNNHETRYFTTSEVREEELQLLRIANKVNEQANYSNMIALSRDIKGLTNVSEAQRKALETILLKDQGVRVLRGRAGTGKSHILGEAYRLMTIHEQKVIGLTPTHKAKSELQSKGYEECHTVKSFLFNLYNDRIKLQKNSLLVLDEAGMVGTKDYLELLKVVRDANCNLILAGDEKQLTSVERGGMFEVFAEEFGSYELSEIRRQTQSWGREMALCFAKDDIRGGVELLYKNKALKRDDVLEESMSALINDFCDSKYDLKEKLAITVRNKEVDILNQGIRELLKTNGVLKGKEYEVISLPNIDTKVNSNNSDFKDVSIGDEYNNSNSSDDSENSKKVEKIRIGYMEGDRILFKASNRKLFIENGEFATLISLSKDEFVAITDLGRKVTFNPSEIAFKHGYASTVYKAQGASIKDVYVLHDRVGNARSSYVGMTRHIEEIKFYSNRESTEDKRKLITQLSRIDNKASSLKFLTADNLAAIKEKNSEEGAGLPRTVLEKAKNWFRKVTTDIGDKSHHNKEYYQYDANPKPLVKIEEVLAQTALDLEAESEVANNNNTYVSDDSALTKVKVKANDNERASERESNKKNSNYDSVSGYRKNEYKYQENQQVEIVKIAVGQPGQERWQEDSNNSKVYHDYTNGYGKKQHDYALYREQEMNELKQRAAYRAELVGYSLLGQPNKYLSNNQKIRWGEKGRLVMQVSGSKAGVWHDFSEGKGGDLLTLVQREKNCSFVEAKGYLKEMVGMPRDILTNIKVANDFQVDELYRKAKEQEQKERYTEANKIRRAKERYEKADSVVFLPVNKVAKRYLSEHRGIEQTLQEFKLSRDIRTDLMWSPKTKQYCPALIAFARNDKGEVTGGQSIYLDKDTAYKADMAINKRSFGKISGSFVEIQREMETGNDDKVNQELGEAGSNAKVNDNNNDSDSNNSKSFNKLDNGITIIAEGVETALSIQEAKIKEDYNIRILCSLGVSNIKNYQPQKGERIIIAADNDGINASSFKAVTKAREKLENERAIVTIIMPVEKGDFNDVLKKDGALAVKKQLESEIEKLVKDQGFERRTEKIIEQNKQEKLRKEPESLEVLLKGVKGVKEIEKFAPEKIDHIITNCESKKIEEAIKITRNIAHKDDKELNIFLTDHHEKLRDIRKLNPNYDINSLKNCLRAVNGEEREKYIDSTWFGVFKEQVIPELNNINKAKLKASSVDDLIKVIEREKVFCQKTYNEYWKLSVKLEYQEKNDHISSINAIYRSKPDLLESISRDARNIGKLGVWQEERVINEIKEAKSIPFAAEALFKVCQKYITEKVEKNLHYFEQNSKVTGIEQDGLKFDSRKSYIEHVKSNQDMSYYLKDTATGKKVDIIYQLEQKWQQDRTKKLELSRGMSFRM